MTELRNISNLDRGYIITSEDEYSYIRLNDQIGKIYVNDYSVKLLLQDRENLELLYDHIDIAISKKDILNITNNVYRDDSGYDVTSDNEISYIQCLTESNQMALSKFIREFFAYKKLIVRHRHIYYSPAVSRNFKILFKFNKNGTQLPGVFGLKNNVNHGGIRIFSSEFNHPFYKFKISNIFVSIQKLFFGYVFKKRVIVVSDWTTNKSPFLIGKLYTKPSLKIWKTAYFRVNTTKINQHIQFRELLNFEKFQANLSSLGVESELIRHMYQVIKSNYNAHYPILNEYFIAYKNLIDDYSPDEIIFPAFTWDLSVPAMQYAYKNNIKISVLLDGFIFGKKIDFQLRDSTNTKYYVSNFYSQSSYTFSKNIEFSLKNYNFQKVESPFVGMYKSVKSLKKIKYDAIVMTFIHDDINPRSRPDLSAKILKDIIDVLFSLGLNKFAIKIKGMRERGYVENLIECYQKIKPQLNIEIIEGYFYEHLFSAKFIVGGISTGVYECLLNNVPYYVYEPKSNGYEYDFLANSILNDFDLIAKTRKELKENILSERHINNINQKYIKLLLE